MKGQAQILVVDDEEAVRYFLETILKDEGYQVLTAVGGEEALKKLEEASFDLAVVDLRMPGSIDGLQLMKEAGRVAPETAIIVLTAYASLESAIEAVRQGAFDYITKPIEIDPLCLAVERALEKKQAQDEIRRRNKELIALNAIATTIGQSLDLEHILNATLDKVLQVIEIDAGWIQLLDEDAGVLSLVAHRGFSQAMVEETRTIKLGESMTGKVAQSGQPIVVDRVSDESRLSTGIGRQEALHVFAGVPLKSKDRVLGVLGVLSRSPRQLNSQEVQLLTAIGHQIGVAVENVRLAEKTSEIEILRELNRLRSELIANVSHELRTPLGLIKIFCTTLLREDMDFDRETQREFLHHIEEEADKLEKIVDNLLDLSRMRDGRLRLDRRPTDMGQLASEVMEAMEVQLTKHRFVHDFPSDPLVTTVDPKRIEQVLRNLLNNAIKYSPEGGTITVQGRRDERQILVRVTDQGIGIPSEDLERVFERFYRVENEITKSVRGAGLGLAVCRGIVEAHGGRIWVESTLGVGSTFYFTLPVAQQ
ncbi:MAG: ATP-binding protein [Anaerolineae bacterium]